MNAENNIRVEMVRMEGGIAPFVQVNYMCKDTQERKGLFLLDSGSTENILSRDVVDDMGSLCPIVDGVKTIVSLAQEVTKAKQVKFSFALGDHQFHETFCVNNKPLPIDVKEMTVLGILGNPFMQQHNLVIDYHDNTLHTSEVSRSNFSIADCAFFFPMVIGLKTYGAPVVPVEQNGIELVTLLDTGASDNVIANQALINNEFKYKRLKGKDVMEGLSGQVAVDEAKVWFKVLSLDGDDNGVAALSRCEHFKVLPDYIYTPSKGVCDENGEQLPPIGVLLGFPFMAKEGWILDFGAKIIYKLKVAV